MGRKGGLCVSSDKHNTAHNDCLWAISTTRTNKTNATLSTRVLITKRHREKMMTLKNHNETQLHPAWKCTRRNSGMAN